MINLCCHCFNIIGGSFAVAAAAFAAVVGVAVVVAAAVVVAVFASAAAYFFLRSPSCHPFVSSSASSQECHPFFYRLLHQTRLQLHCPMLCLLPMPLVPL